MFFSVTITREGGIIIRVTDKTVAARIAALLESLGPDLIDIIQFAA